MGLNSGGGSRTYLKISEGRISVNVPEGTPNAIECVSSRDATKKWWEVRYPSVTGKITGIEKRETKFGVDLSISLQDTKTGELFQLQMPWSSKYSTGFFNCMPNIDFSGEVTFTPWMKVIDDKKKTALYITNGKPEVGKENVKWYWTQENPQDCPPMVQIRVKGQLEWDDSDRQEFFENYLNKHVIPKLSAAAPVVATHNPESDDFSAASDLPWDKEDEQPF
jgi:hypothetical protein